MVFLFTDEVKKQLELSNTKLIFTTPELVPTVKEALKLNKQNIPIIVMDLITGRPEGTVSYYELIGDDVDLSVLKDRDFHFGQAYGLTETAPLATIAPLGYKNYASVGFPVPNTQLRIVDENLNNLGPDEVCNRF
ncbi:unnamed protein product [Leptidea sinapis]|uniref:AMP-dependent synthetase/ligase domain-containing protein n=1 Tax=Leptidea sinapis TaxID=189913 RepID=A0A5E4QHL6_9NEOP|nr:unnamed protein product [Leptidea sinapis]